MAMDSTVQAAVVTAMTDLKTTALTEYGTILPLAFGAVITLAVAGFMIRRFRGLIHV